MSQLQYTRKTLMINKHQIIDLNYFCDIGSGQLFLTLSNDVEHAKIKRKIRISPKRYLYLDYQEEEPVRVIWRHSYYNYNESPTMYDVIYVNGVYDVYKTLKDVGIDINIEPLNYSYWRESKKNYHEFIQEIVFSDYARIKLRNNKEHKYELITLKSYEIDDVNVSLESIYVKGYFSQELKILFDKILSGEKIKMADFIPVVDEEKKEGIICFEFDGLDIEITSKRIKVKKKFTFLDEEEVVDNEQ